MKCFWSFLLALASLPLAINAQNTSLPVVDLGYSPSRAYNFSNIRFGQPPIGDLRFAAPRPAWEGPQNSTISDGSQGVICPQAVPLWQNITALFAASYGMSNVTFNTTAVAAQFYGNQTALNSIKSLDTRQTEDCLFLDVVVPEGIYNNANKSYGAPVLFWIYGGGYTEGDKTSGGVDPTGLLLSAQKATGQQFIWVAINYRLGALGYLSGPTFSIDGTPNAAIYDQRLGLDWVQKYIHLFGGDPTRVTVMGESAGGGSIMHLITAFNGQKGTKFAQAIPQSPAWYPTISSEYQEDVFNRFLNLANVTSLKEARNLSTEVIQQANFVQIANSEYGTFSYGPVVDGIITPQLPGRALLSGNFDPKLRVMSGHNFDEGFLFSKPNISTDAEFNAFVSQYYPGISDVIKKEIVSELYPPIYNGSYGYSDEFSRVALIVSQSVFTCNTYYLANAYKNRTYNYRFSVPPGFHGQDVPYTFAKNYSTAQVPIVAEALQQYISTFVITGAPSNANSPNLPAFPVYGRNNTVVNLNSTISTYKDELASPRCAFWQKALYY